MVDGGILGLKLNICMIDGVAYYARWKVGQEFAYTEKERDRLVERMQKEGGGKVPVEELPEPPGFSVTRNEDGSPKKYASRSEAIRHIEQGVEPESMTIPRLRERVVAAEERANIAELKAEQAKAQVADALSRAQQAENILASMETRLRQVEEKSGISSKK